MKTLKNKIKESPFFSEFKESLKEGEEVNKLTFSHMPSLVEVEKSYVAPKASISFDMPSYDIPSYDSGDYTCP